MINSEENINMSEAQLQTKSLNAESSEFLNQLYRDMRPRLYRFAYSYTMNAEIAEDFVQDSFERLLGVINSLPENVDICNYLYTSVKNACLNYYKHLQVEDSHRSKLAEALIFASTLEYEEQGELFDKVNELLQQLPEQQRLVLEMKLLKNMSYADIAKEMGISEQTVHTHVKRAYKYIREHVPVLYGMLVLMECVSRA